MADSQGAKKILRVGILTPVLQLDAPDCHDFVSALVQSQIFESPYAAPVEGASTPEPILCSETLVAETSDGSGYSALMREGVRFSDGTLVTPNHVMASLSRSQSFDQARVTVRGDRVVFALKKPNPRFDLVLAHRFCSVGMMKNGRPIGTGPFTLSPDSRPDAVRLVRNPHYRLPVPLDEVRFTVYPTGNDQRASRLVQAIEAGEVDYTNLLSRDEVSLLRNARKVFLPGTSTAILHFNCERPPFQDVRVRRAFALALNRDEIARTTYTNALAFVAGSLLPPTMDASHDGLRFNPERARAELRASGVKLPERLTLLTVWGPRPYLPHPRKTAELLAAQLSQLGVKVEVVETRNSSDSYDRVARGQFDLYFGGWIADSTDPVDFLSALLSSQAVPALEKSGLMRANRSRYKNSAMDRALDQLRVDPAQAKKTEVLQLLRDEVPLVPLMYGPTIVVYTRRMQNFHPAIGLPSFGKVDLLPA